MTDSYYAGVYWPARLESAEECARRTETFFHLLSQCDEIDARWYEDKGTLIVLAPERLSASNPEHLCLGRRVQEVLDSNELLRPVLP